MRSFSPEAFSGSRRAGGFSRKASVLRVALSVVFSLISASVRGGGGTVFWDRTPVDKQRSRLKKTAEYVS